MSERQTSLHNLAHIANMSHELQVLNQQLRDESVVKPKVEVQSTQPTTSFREQSSAPPDDNRTPPKNGRLKRMACVECRQQKSKCDASERDPLPCTRCSKKGLSCDLKSDYKRTYKRARIEQIEKEFSILAKTLSDVQAQELLLKVPSLAEGLQQPLRGRNQDGQIVGQSQSYNNTFKQEPNGMSRKSLGIPGPTTGYGLPHGYNQGISGTYGPASGSDVSSSIPNTPSIQRPTIDHHLNSATSTQPNNSPLPTVIISEEALICTEKSLSSVTLSPEVIRELVLEFVAKYHRILPVVDVQRGPERIYRLCPALFWSIMLVSLRRFEKDADKALLLELSPMVKDVLAEILISPVTRYNPTEEDQPILNASSFFSVQAFLLYTYWPPITSSLSADSSWNTIGSAFFQAIRLGLHTATANFNDQNTTQANLEKVQEQTRTWIICNVVSQTVASSFGFPAFVQFDSSILSSCRPGSAIHIAPQIQAMMEIAQFEDQVANTLNSNSSGIQGLADPTERLPLLKVLVRQLDELEIKIAYELPQDDGIRKFSLLVARIHLLTYYFMDSSRIAPFELQRGLVQVYNAAVSLITHAQLCQAKDKKFVRYLPGVYILSIWQASCIIGKLSHSPMKKFIDLGTGRESYQAAISLAAKASILKHDIAHRSSGIMRNMWQFFRAMDEKKLTGLSINIRTRMSASIFFDCLHLLRDQVGMLKLNREAMERKNIAEGNGAHDRRPEDDEDDDEDEDYNNNLDGDDKNDDSSSSVLESDEEEEVPTGDKSQKSSTPGSNTSSRTKRQRSLSNTVNAESKARRIIRTIPFDPQPISAQGGKRMSIFNVVNQTPQSSDSSIHNQSPEFKNPSSPLVKQSQGQRQHSQQSQPHQQQAQQPQPQQQQQPPQFPPQQSYQDLQVNATQQPYQQNRQQHSKSHVNKLGSLPAHDVLQQQEILNGNSKKELTLSEMVMNESPLQGGLENLDMNGIDFSSDLLWKDVDSVMNDFGFHT
ncbi:regulatory protein Leu3p [[Candida] anglica]|uniref:Regulatory protein Leu3p n=1 Tax=[Candida] anglica TaxID=148631 RepID=A0ABP0ECG1_9ASCO